MGRLVQVRAGYTAVLLPDKNGSGSSRNYVPGDQVAVTDAEFNAFNAATLAAISTVSTGIPDPTRQGATIPSNKLSSASFTTAAGGTVSLGTNWIVAPAGGVTYSPGFLVLPANNPGTGVVGPTSGSSYGVTVYHTQGATPSVAPTAKNWFGGTFRTDTATVTNASSTIADTNIQASDLYRPVSGTGIPAGSFVGTVTPGVSFVLSSTAGTTTAANATASGTSVALGPLTRWVGGTVPTFTASAGAVDYFRFDTYDGGSSFYGVIVAKGLA